MRIVKHQTRDVTEECSAADTTIPIALNLGMQAVEQLGTCRVVYGGKDGVTIAGQRFVEADATIVVATRTGHTVAKSLRRLMRTAVGLKRKDAA